MIRPGTLADMVRWVQDSMSFRIASARFLDAFYAASPTDRQHMLEPEPGLTDDQVTDALVGAMGEHLAQRWDLRTPSWVDDPRRFLRTPWFATRLRGLHARLSVESPLAFRRRFLFVENEPLNRARMHKPDRYVGVSSRSSDMGATRDGLGYPERAPSPIEPAHGLS